MYNLKNKKNKNKLINEIMYCNPYTFYGKHKLFCENLGTALDHYNHNKNIKFDFSLGDEIDVRINEARSFSLTGELCF